MKKALIISYFFPPCNLTAANRISSWQKLLPQNGVYPIIITRNWTGNEKNEAERLESSGSVEKHVVTEQSEVFYMPYKASLRDSAFIKGQQSIFYKYYSKLLTFIHLWIQNISVFSIPYNNLYFKAKEILKKDKNISTIIISANPFEQFFFGYLLKKEFPHIKWIADYRDDWTTNELYEKNTFFTKHLNTFNQYFEKKWIKSASYISSVSELYVKKLTNLHSKKTYLVMNGFKEQIHNILPKENFKNFTIVYSGTIYKKQEFDIFFNAVYKFSNNEPNQKIDVLFLGSKESLPPNYFDEFLKIKPENVTIESTNRVSWKENIKTLKTADLLFLSSYGNVKGIPTSKLFDYIACEKPILLCPSDEDIMQEIIESTLTGKACKDEASAYNFIKLVFEKTYKFKPIYSKIDEYATKNQVKILSKLIKQ